MELLAFAVARFGDRHVAGGSQVDGLICLDAAADDGETAFAISAGRDRNITVRGDLRTEMGGELAGALPVGERGGVLGGEVVTMRCRIY